MVSGMVLAIFEEKCTQIKYVLKHNMLQLKIKN